MSAEAARAAEYRLIVNCTAVGMEGAGDPFADLPLDPDRLGPGLVLIDLVYGGDETRLIAAGRESGAQVVGGLEILVAQGAESLRIWTGRQVGPEVIAAMRKAAAGG